MGGTLTGVLRRGAQDVTVRLAQAYGYCWGVERAVQMAYEARKQYPEAKLHVTNEIIHNPAVNQVRCCLGIANGFCWVEWPPLVGKESCFSSKVGKFLSCDF